jgi:hypothetical protein
MKKQGRGIGGSVTNRLFHNARNPVSAGPGMTGANAGSLFTR